MGPAEVAWRAVQSARRAARGVALRLAPPRSATDTADVPRPSRAFPVRFFNLALQWPGDIDWARDHRNGVSAPMRFYGALDYRDAAQVGDIKVTWELNRHQFIVPWAREHAATGDPECARAIASLVTDWIRANPRHVGVNWASSLELALRILSWGIAFDLAGADPALRGVRPRVAASVREQARFIRSTLSLHSSANNHLIGELVGLLAAAVLFPELPEAARWRDFAFRALVREAGRQVHPDGVNREQAVYYHHYVAEYLCVAVALMRRAGRADAVPPALLERVFRMVVFVHAMTDDAGSPFDIGDTDDGVVAGLNEPHRDAGVYESLLWTGAAMFGTTAFADHAAAIARNAGRAPRPDPKTAYWWGGLDAPLLPRQAPPGPDHFFPDGGYFTDTADGWTMLLKGGPFGYPSIAAHAHCDQLSFQLRRGDTEVLADAGTYCYHTLDAWRRAFRGTAAHNTVCVDGADQAEYAGAFLWATHADARMRAELRDGRFVVTASHDGYRRLPDPVTHTRTVEPREGPAWIITDELTAARTHEYALHWNTAPEVEVSPAADAPAAWRLRLPDGTTLLLTIACSAGLRASLARGDGDARAGWWSRAYLEKRPAWRIRAEAAGASCRMVTTIRLENTHRPKQEGA